MEGSFQKKTPLLWYTSQDTSMLLQGVQDFFLGGKNGFEYVHFLVIEFQHYIFASIHQT